MAEFTTDIEIKICVDYDAHKAEAYNYQYPAAPASMEINDITFLTEDGRELKTLEELTEYALNLHAESLVQQGWECLDNV
jgi:hypothetical protein